ncbi:MAG: hypothetical protein IH948_00325 [Bacteroidetes bacterium]|nr:hypothetical protein [Bacteroidota bacterium]
MEILAGISILYVLFGFALWIIPFDSGAGYTDVMASDTSPLFILLWGLAIFSEKIREGL